MSATPYDYTPTQSMVVSLYDYYRTSLMNAKYYARRLRAWKIVNTVADATVAVLASSAVASFSIWKTEYGVYAFNLLLASVAVISALRPILRIPDRIDRLSKLHYGYLEVYYRIETLISTMRSSEHVNEEHRLRASDIAERFRALELEGDAYQNQKKLLTIQDEVEQILPADRFWLPQE